MKPFSAGRSALCFTLASFGISIAQQQMPATQISASAVHNCSTAQSADFPKAVITNGSTKAVVYLPDTAKGYYRATRFDWAGVIGCLSANGHTYFGQWFPRYDPLANDSITGPVEEFKTEDGALNYAEAKIGEVFVKPGVGVLRKVSDKPYSSYFTYPLVDAGKWKVHATSSGVRFTQQLKAPGGIAYTYRKDVQLEPQRSVLVLRHELINRGAKPLELDVYDHDFFMLDDSPTGPDLIVQFPFHPEPEHALLNGGTVQGNSIVYTSELQPKQTVNSVLTGYSEKVSDYDFTVEDRRTHVGVQQTADRPLSHVNFWSIRTTVCPEGYIHLSIAPGQTAHWTIRYRFYS